MNFPCTAHTTIQRERGAVFIVMLVFMIMGVAAFLVSSLNSSAVKISQDNATTDVLAKAKEALIGYAVTYGDTHPGNVNGYLPLPDLGTTRNSTPYEGVSAGNFSGNAINLSVVGRLPWKTLGISPLRDGNGECLWYAVSGTYQNTQQTDLMNWDTPGQFDTYTSNGTPAGTVSTIGTNYHQMPAAIIFATGPILTGQNRSTSALDNVTECGGNYDARNYLDTLNPNPLINSIVNYFAASTNNSTGNFTYVTPKQFAIGSISDSNGNILVNDRLLTISSSDIFGTIKKRNDFGVFVTTLLNAAISCAQPPVSLTFNTASPYTVESGGTNVGSLITGRVPKSCLISPLDNWRDNLLYATCNPSSACLTVNGSPCHGIVIFTGMRTATQVRATNLQKNTWGNYLEDTPAANLTAFTNGTTAFSGAISYNPASPSTDIFACIP